MRFGRRPLRQPGLSRCFLCSNQLSYSFFIVDRLSVEVGTMYPKEFSAILAIGLVLICAYLLTTGKLGPWQFGFALLVSVFLGGRTS